jgi:hypothetical protein
VLRRTEVGVTMDRGIFASTFVLRMKLFSVPERLNVSSSV